MRDQDELQRTTLEALARSEARFRSLIEGAPDAIGVIRDGKTLFVNPALVRFLGYASADELVGTSVSERIHPDDREIFLSRTRNRKLGDAALPREYRILRPDGDVVSAEIAAMLIEYEGAPALLCHLRDVTERRRLQAQLLQADRLASVGTLAARVAHEINNPLSYTMVNLELLQRAIPELIERARRGENLLSKLDELGSAVQTAREGAERVRDIVRDLKRGIAEALGADVGIDPSDGPTSAPRSRPDSTRPSDAPRRGRVLVIDDEPAVAQSLRLVLKAEHEVEIAYTGREALERLSREHDFDLILCDLMMPEVSGIEVFESMMARDPAYAERIVFISGGAFTAQARAFLEQAGRTVVAKPFDLDALMALARRRVKTK